MTQNPPETAHTKSARKRARDSLAQVPAVPGATLLGHMGQFRDDWNRLRLLRAAAAAAPVSRLRFLHVPVLSINSPEGAREVLVEQAAAFEKAPATRVILRPLAGDGLFTSEGALWKRQRRLMSPLFHPSQLATYVPAMGAVTRHAAATLRDGESLDLSRLMTRITMGIVGATLFGTETLTDADTLGDALTTTLKWVDENQASPFLTLQLSVVSMLEKLRPRVPGAFEDLQRRLESALEEPVLMPGARDPALDDAVRVLDTYIRKMIGERREHPPVDERVDLLTRLLYARDTEADHGSARGAAHGMSDDQVRDEALTLFVAGHETTANALSWAFYLLARHPEARARVQAEADALGGDPITVFDPAKFVYTTRVLKEALRLYPPLILLGRRTLSPFILDGTRYPSRIPVFINVYGIHHLPDVWPDPDRFDPDRFLPEREAARHKAAWIPFGVGPRVCIGNAFALMEGPIVLLTLMRMMRFDINPWRVIEPDAFATLRPKGGVPAVIALR
jgi:cytochrome P450